MNLETPRYTGIGREKMHPPWYVRRAAGHAGDASDVDDVTAALPHHVPRRGPRAVHDTLFLPAAGWARGPNASGGAAPAREDMSVLEEQITICSGDHERQNEPARPVPAALK